MDVKDSTQDKTANKSLESRNYKNITTQTISQHQKSDFLEPITCTIKDIPNHKLQIYQTHINHKKPKLIIIITSICFSTGRYGPMMTKKG